MTRYQTHRLGCWTCRETQNRCDPGREIYAKSARPPLTQAERDLVRGALRGRVDLDKLGLYPRLYGWFRDEGHLPFAMTSTTHIEWILKNAENYL